MRLRRRLGTGGCALLVAALPLALPGPLRAAPPGAPTATPAQRAVAIATPTIVNIEVRWDGYLYDPRSATLVDTAPVSISAWCPGVGVGREGYLATTAPCLDAHTVVPDLVRRVLATKVSAGLMTQDEARGALDGLLDNAVIVGDPVGEDARRTIQVRRSVNGDGPLPASVVGHSDLNLVTLLKIDKENQPMLVVADGTAVGDHVVVLTCAADDDQPVQPSSYQATITAVAPQLLTMAPTAPTTTPTPAASSTMLPATVVPGGVVLAEDGTLVGLLNGTAEGKQVVIPAAQIAQALTAADIDAEPGTVDDAFREGLDALYAGQYTQAVESFDTVLAVIPSHASARTYRDQARSLRSAQGGPPAQPGFFDTVRTWLTGHSGVLVGLAVLAAIAVFLVRRQHPHDHDHDPDGGSGHGDRSGPRENAQS